ncbi:hypothetical protein JTB14_013746 [Gonioctena quinquepunctata]|nr:hypothetical protein JTB14_013746 [Gonioctena quinquepunctata]
MLDIELALKLSNLEDEELCSEKSEISEMVSRPDIKKWVEGEHPWQDKLDGASFPSAKKEKKVSKNSLPKKRGRPSSSVNSPSSSRGNPINRNIDTQKIKKKAS